MSTQAAKPLVTYALIAFNQEATVAEAVASALSQTYSPLELIISDDCSSDRTFEIMSDIVHSYRGPAAITLNRNKVNLGLIRHVNLMLDLARGELIVLAAGDDVSVGWRTARLVSEWLRSDGKLDGLCSAYTIEKGGGGESRVVDRAGAIELESFVQVASANILGATAAWTKRLWRAWGPLPLTGLAEDRLLSFCAMLSGGVGYVPEPLVRCWTHETIAPPGERSLKEKWRWAWARNVLFYREYEALLRRPRAKEQARDHQAELIARRISTRRKCLEADVRLLGGRRLDVLLFATRLVAGMTWYRPPLRRRLSAARRLVREALSPGPARPEYDPMDHRALRR